ncbi:uncharacterized mitochondrial protein AtMg00860-like [Vigna umbellata]|uniref:uncharacterized mitochondrial protein AtMg00860-like n=1 Tax=Vigna umbellata TaxID=87088 RepID=UPI001F5F4694|nr:uncharacterized mitochondrial protein AtMg00860-like [Vigna umbellata]
MIYYCTINLGGNIWSTWGQVLGTLKQHRWVANRKKCEFGKVQIRYLGHNIYEKGVEMDTEKVEVVRGWTKPGNLKALRGFLGLTGYYRIFARDNGKITHPLTELLKKGNFIWLDTARAAMEKRKEAITTSPILALPDFNQ